jgi:hypothetical protein
MTKEKFVVFERIRESGKTNMFDYPVIIAEAAKRGVIFTRENFLDIIANYRQYRWEYRENRKIIIDNLQFLVYKSTLVIFGI